MHEHEYIVTYLAYETYVTIIHNYYNFHHIATHNLTITPNTEVSFSIVI